MTLELVRFVLVRFTMAAPKSGTANWVIWVSFLVWGVLSLAAGWKLSRANQEYLRLYREQVSPNTPSPEDLYERSLEAPWGWWAGIFSFSWWLRKQQRRPGPTAAVEAARQQVLFWRKMAIIIVFVGSLVPILIALYVSG